ncbi:S46 family peptidase [soil metagenome]
MLRQTFALALAAAFAISAAPALADEGMWTFDNFPSAKVQAAYGVKVDQKWLDRVQAASVRLTSGCSASLVSKDGLVFTNHHCVVDCAQSLSDGKTDYVKDGFTTAARTEEKKCAGMQAEVLVSVTDLTGQIAKATAGKTGIDFVKGRDAAKGVAEDAACGKDETLRCQLVTLYRGGQYKLYKYRIYSDVRLVFAPEFATAFFGGDPDNFNFPRFNLDTAFVRLYENGKPIASPQHLIWQSRAPKDGEVTFVSGNPGGTDRMLTVAQLETQRDLTLPISQLQRSELRGRLIEFSGRDAESKRIATDPLFGVENGFKVFYGRQFALNDHTFLDAKRAAEADLRAKVAADPKLAADIGDPWGEIAQAQGPYANRYLRFRQLESGAGSLSELFGYARELVRAGQERAKPSAERLPEYSDAGLALMAKQVLDAQPVDPTLEQLYLTFWLSKTREYLTTDDAATKLLLGKESPEGMAARLVAGTKLGDPAERKRLWDGGLPAIQASTDPMIQLALRLDPPAREVRTAWETEVTGPTDRAAERIARAKFAAYGDAVYPDATFTLRLSYGKVAGWTYRGTTIAPFTTFAGLYDRATGAEPFQLAPRWVAAKDKLNPDTVFDFVTTNDIIGGNSGSPVINAKAEILGAAFDGNIHSLGGDYGYDGTINRTVVVATSAATEALEKVYGQTALVKELTAK